MSAPDPAIAAFRARLAAAQAAARSLRLAAFVDYEPLVCGLRLRPVTLRTYTLLLAWRNAFVVGGPVTIKDIVQFVWAHHPRFSQFAERDRARVQRQCFRALHLGWFRRRYSPAAFTAAIAEIRRIVHEALADFPAGSDDAEPLPHALAPQLVSLLLRGHPGALDFTAACHLVNTLPLARLMQFIREILHRLSQGKDALLTPDEARVWHDYLDHQNLPAPAATPASVPLSSVP